MRRRLRPLLLNGSLSGLLTIVAAVGCSKTEPTSGGQKAPSSTAQSSTAQSEAPPAPKPEAGLVGTWSIDVEATLKVDPRMAALGAEEFAQQLQMAKGLLSTVSFEFSADGKLSARFGDEKKVGTFTVKSVAGTKLTLETRTPMGAAEERDAAERVALDKGAADAGAAEKKGAAEKIETLTATLDGDTLHLGDDAQTLVLRRNK